MSGSYRFVALPAERFAELFDLGDEALRDRGVLRMTVDEKPGYPCRVSLADAEIGETVLLVPFTHHDVATPYRASGPVFVRAGAKTAIPAAGEIPHFLTHRMLSVRAYDAGGMMLDAVVTHGEELDAAIRRVFANASVSYLHVHNAGPGCYNCAVVRT